MTNWQRIADLARGADVESPVEMAVSATVVLLSSIMVIMNAVQDEEEE